MYKVPLTHLYANNLVHFTPSVAYPKTIVGQTETIKDEKKRSKEEKKGNKKKVWTFC